MMNKDIFERLVQEMEQIYNFAEAEELWNGDYESQVKSQSFVKILTFNCMLLDSLYRCFDRGCHGCVADDVFRRVDDEEAKKITNAAKSALSKRREVKHEQ